MISFIKDAVSKTGISYKKIFVIFSLAFIAYVFLSTYTDLSPQGARMSVIFIMAVVGIMLKVCHQILWLLLMVSIASLSGAIDVCDGFSGFTKMVPWLVFAVLSLSPLITTTPLSLRLAYFFMKHFGGNILGLSFSIAFTELIVAPMLPSNTARAASVGLPLATSLTKYISSNVPGVSEQSIGQYLSIFCSFCNTISSGLFYTGMISNALIPEITAKAGVNFTWFSWFKFMAIPYLITLFIIPFILKFCCKLKVDKLGELQKKADQNSKELGKITPKEKIILSVFFGMLVLWVLSEYIHISVLTTALIGVCLFVFLGVLSMKDVFSNNNAFTFLIFLGVLISLVNCLGSTGVMTWFSNKVALSLNGMSPNVAFLLLTAIYYYAQFFFNGESSKIVALYAPFFTTGLAMGINPIMLAVTLASFSSAADFLAPHVCPTCLTLSSTGYVSFKKWLFCGVVTSVIFLTIWYTYSYMVWM